MDTPRPSIWNCRRPTAARASCFRASRPALAPPERERQRERRRARRGGGASGPAGRLENVQKVLTRGPGRPGRTGQAGNLMGPAAPAAAVGRGRPVVLRAGSSHRCGQADPLRSHGTRAGGLVRSPDYSARSSAARSMNSGRVNPLLHQLSARTCSGDGCGSVRLVIAKPDLRSSSV